MALNLIQTQMIQRMKKICLLVLVSLAIAHVTPFKAAAKFLGVLQRYSIGYSFLFANGKYSGQDTYPGIIDTSYEANIHTTAAFGLTIVFMPFSFTWKREEWYNTY